MQRKDHTGKVFNELTVVRFVGTNHRGKALWECRCTCGGDVTLPSDVVSAGVQKSCGCLKYRGFDGEHARRTKYPTLDAWLANCTPVGGCLEWNGYISPDGYAHSGEHLHRKIYRLATGESPQVVMHTCDNRKCINPSHLVAGTFKENSQDMARKGRQGKQVVHPSEYPNIKALLLAGETQGQVAAKYGVTQSTISAIKRKHLT
jgi:hypothetical protein